MLNLDIDLKESDNLAEKACSPVPRVETGPTATKESRGGSQDIRYGIQGGEYAPVQSGWS